MGRQPRSGDIPWLSAHSILNWIGGDTSMLDLSRQMSSLLSDIFEEIRGLRKDLSESLKIAARIRQVALTLPQ
jgi:hypothetical protein